MNVRQRRDRAHPLILPTRPTTAPRPSCPACRACPSIPRPHLSGHLFSLYTRQPRKNGLLWELAQAKSSSAIISKETRYNVACTLQPSCPAAHVCIYNWHVMLQQVQLRDSLPLQLSGLSHLGCHGMFCLFALPFCPEGQGRSLLVSPQVRFRESRYCCCRRTARILVARLGEWGVCPTQGRRSACLPGGPCVESKSCPCPSWTPLQKKKEKVLRSYRRYINITKNNVVCHATRSY